MGIIISDLYKIYIDIIRLTDGQKICSVPVSGDNSDASATMTGVAIRCSVYDFNNNPVKNKTISITVQLGFIRAVTFMQKTLNVTTNNLGQVQVDYVSSQTGTEIVTCNNKSCTFEVTHQSCSTLKDNLAKNQTNWIQVNYLSEYQDYNSSTGLYVRRVGNLVELRGAWTTTKTKTASSATQFATLPSSIFYPQKGHVSRQQGSGKNGYILTVSNDGKISWGGYGVTSSTSLPEGVWGLVSGAFWTIYDT